MHSSGMQSALPFPGCRGLQTEARTAVGNTQPLTTAGPDQAPSLPSVLQLPPSVPHPGHCCPGPGDCAIHEPWG